MRTISGGLGGHFGPFWAVFVKPIQKRSIFKKNEKLKFDRLIVVRMLYNLEPKKTLIWVNFWAKKIWPLSLKIKMFELLKIFALKFSNPNLGGTEASKWPFLDSMWFFAHKIGYSRVKISSVCLGWHWKSQKMISEIFGYAKYGQLGAQNVLWCQLLCFLLTDKVCQLCQVVISPLGSPKCH